MTKAKERFIKTHITKILRITYPIIQNKIIWLAKTKLTAAVSNAKKLNTIISAHFASGRELDEEIKKTRALTDKPFAVNISLMPATRVLPTGEFIEAIIKNGVKAVETSDVRTPGEFLPKLKKAGVKIIHKVASLRHAQKAEEQGVDAVALLKIEGKGHINISDITTFIKIPLAVKNLKIPVIAAGGIGDAKGFVAALALGAEGVIMGTRFMATKECPAHPNFKNLLLRAKETDTVLINRSIRDTSRALQNDASEKVLEMETRGASLEELLTVISGENAKKVYLLGELNAGITSCGQVVGLIDDLPTVKEVIESIIHESRIVGQRLSAIGILK